LNPSMLACSPGGSESINADHAAHWPIIGGHIYVVCDGIGHNSETAEAVNKFCSLFQCFSQRSPIKDESTLHQAIIESVRILENECGRGVSFCMTAALTLEEYVVVAHCGDCRLGYLTTTGINWKTLDDVPYYHMLRNGTISHELYLKCRHLVACKIKLGEPQDNIKTFTLSRPEQGCLLLCSDGFWSEMESELNDTADVCRDNIGRKLSYLTKHAHDNFSVIIV